MPQPVVYQGNLDALLKKWKDEGTLQVANGQCARLPQVLTSVGHTSGWIRGPRVLDVRDLKPGTVIANFKWHDERKRWEFPNQEGWHAGLFYKFEGRRVMTNGLPCEFSMIDQWVDKRPGLRGMAILTEAFKKLNPRFDKPSNRADEFHVVLV